MTLSILVREPGTQRLGGAATTGNLCVGAWVLHGAAGAGLAATQGLAPNPHWGPAAIGAMRAGATARETVVRTTRRDAGRAARQIAALDRAGATAGYDGRGNVPSCGHIAAPDLIVAGNWLRARAVLEAAAEGYAAARGDLAARLIAALQAGARAGGDARGLQSAALLVLAPDAPPLDLRIDHDPDPLAALAALRLRTQAPEYRAWLATLPTLDRPGRVP